MKKRNGFFQLTNAVDVSQRLPIYTIRMKTLSLLVTAVLTVSLGGCPSNTIYQTPVTKFQTSAVSFTNIVRPYLQNINTLIVTANLYDEIGTGGNWKINDLKNGIPEKEIQVRLKALSAITNYANALAAVADSKDIANLKAATNTLGTNINGLSTTIQSLNSDRTSQPPTSEAGKKAAQLDLSGPVSSIVTLVGTLVIENMQRQAIEDAITKANKPVFEMLDLLKQDLVDLAFVGDAAYSAKKTGLVFLYQKIRVKADPKDLPALIDKLVQENNSIETMRALQVDTLFNDMKAAHIALVTFAQSDKSPKSLSDLAAQIDVFTTHVQLFEQAIASIQSSTKSTK